MKDSDDYPFEKYLSLGCCWVGFLIVVVYFLAFLASNFDILVFIPVTFCVILLAVYACLYKIFSLRYASKISHTLTIIIILIGSIFMYAFNPRPVNDYFYEAYSVIAGAFGRESIIRLNPTPKVIGSKEWADQKNRLELKKNKTEYEQKMLDWMNACERAQKQVQDFVEKDRPKKVKRDAKWAFEHPEDGEISQVQFDIVYKSIINGEFYPDLVGENGRKMAQKLNDNGYAVVMGPNDTFFVLTDTTTQKPIKGDATSELKRIKDEGLDDTEGLQPFNSTTTPSAGVAPTKEAPAEGENSAEESSVDSNTDQSLTD